VVPPNFQVILIRASLDPKAIAASGVTSSSVGPMLQAAADAINADLTALPNADASYAAARTSSDRLAALIRSGLGSQEEVSAYQAAMANLATATTQRQNALTNVFTAATASLLPTQRSPLTQIRANRAQDFSRDFPLEFLVIDRPEAEWVALRDALANEKIAQKYPDTLDPQAQANLAVWRANPSVAAAKISLVANTDSDTAAWNAAVGQ
jgi:hypothetical protein